MKKKIAEHQREIGQQPSPVIDLHMNNENHISDHLYYPTDTSGDDP